jgi:hypothetical protein
VYQIAQQFGIDWKELCKFNALDPQGNCSALPFDFSALKIPVTQGSGA